MEAFGDVLRPASRSGFAAACLSTEHPAVYLRVIRPEIQVPGCRLDTEVASLMIVPRRSRSPESRAHHGRLIDRLFPSQPLQIFVQFADHPPKAPVTFSRTPVSGQVPDWR